MIEDANETTLSPVLAEKREAFSVDTASKVGPDSYVTAAPSWARLRAKVEELILKVAFRTKRPPPLETPDPESTR